MELLQKEVEKKIKRLSKQKHDIPVEYLLDPKPIQIVFRKKPRKKVFYRAKPITAYRPTVNQLKTRIIFGELAQMAKGKKLDGELPPAAEMVKQMKGVKFGRTERKKKWELILAETLRRG